MIAELHPPDSGRAFAAMRAMRTAAGDEAAFAAHVDDVLRPEGYRLVAALADGERQAAAVAGFRSGHNLAWGHFLYVDDLSTHPDHRRRGHAGSLLDWLLEEARRLGCDQLHLDSGVQVEREDAHRLYFDKRLRISSYHFQREV